MDEHIAFMKNAFHQLVERGIISKDDLTNSNVTDEMIKEFESEFDIVIPTEVIDYLKSYNHTISMLCAAVPDDYIGEDSDIIHEINDMTSDEIAEMDEEEATYLSECWSGILQIPKEDPLKNLKERLLGFREYADSVEGVNEDSLKRFLPVGDWMSAGPLCIDTENSKENVDVEDPDTWQVKWFDHEEFDWQEAGYMDEDGRVTGLALFPDFETFIRLYFYGVYDKLYDKQMKDEDEDLPDRSTWLQ